MSRLTWFKFHPAMFAQAFCLDDAQAGKMFKTMLSRLLSNEAPDGSIEADMIAESRSYSESRRKAIKARWQGTKPGDWPEMDEVYEFAQLQGITDMVARNWYEWQSKIGFAQLDNWKGALVKFSKLKVTDAG